MGAFLPQFDMLRVALWTAKEEKRIREREGRGEDDKNIFLDRYKFSQWVKTELVGGWGDEVGWWGVMCSFWQVNFFPDSVGTFNISDRLCRSPLSQPRRMQMRGKRASCKPNISKM